MRILHRSIVALSALVLSTPVWGDIANVSWHMVATSCPGGQTGHNLLATDGAISGEVSGRCVIPPLDIDSVSNAQFNAQPFDLPNLHILHVADATANTTGLAVVAGAVVTVTEMVTITPPPGSPNATATVQAGDAYDIFISHVGGFVKANGEVSITLAPLFGIPLFASQTEMSNGEFSGPLLTSDLTAFGCPCEFLYTVEVTADAENGAYAAAADPAPFLKLPAGWTYSFSAPPAPVPEPSSLALLSGMLLVLLGWIRRAQVRSN